MIRIADSNDLQRIVDIYNQGIPFHATADIAPVTVQDRLGWFEEHTRDFYPIYIYEKEGQILGWCSISPYRKGRLALSGTAEISYFVDNRHQRQGIASELVRFAMNDCGRINKRILFAIILEHNLVSMKLLTKFGFEKWGFLPEVAEFDGAYYGHVYYGKILESK